MPNAATTQPKTALDLYNEHPSQFPVRLAGIAGGIHALHLVFEGHNGLGNEDLEHLRDLSALIYREFQLYQVEAEECLSGIKVVE